MTVPGDFSNATELSFDQNGDLDSCHQLEGGRGMHAGTSAQNELTASPVVGKISHARTKPAINHHWEFNLFLLWKASDREIVLIACHLYPSSSGTTVTVLMEAVNDCRSSYVELQTGFICHFFGCRPPELMMMPLALYEFDFRSLHGNMVDSIRAEFSCVVEDTSTTCVSRQQWPRTPSPWSERQLVDACNLEKELELTSLRRAGAQLYAWE
nr:hypothetical protein Iba_chr11bCG16190 [Ipomoea batatas]